MRESALSECLAILHAMQHGREQEWTDALRPLYVMALRPMQDDEAKAACSWAALNEEWRPSPARLRQIAARLAAPYPDADACYSEIMDKAQSIGLYGERLPGTNCYVEGPPPMSHPLAARIVAHCGGWQMICDGEAQMQEGLKKQIRGAHEACARQWEQDVSIQLALPLAERNPRFFRSYAPHTPICEPPLVGEEARALPMPPVRDEQEVSEEARRILEDLAARRRMPPSSREWTPEQDDADRARKRAAIERLREEVGRDTG